MPDCGKTFFVIENTELTGNLAEWTLLIHTKMVDSICYTSYM